MSASPNKVTVKRHWSDSEIKDEVEVVQITKRQFFDIARYIRYADWGLGAISGILSAVTVSIPSIYYFGGPNPIVSSLRPLQFTFPLAILSLAAVQYIKPDEHYVTAESWCGVQYFVQKVKRCFTPRGRGEAR